MKNGLARRGITNPNVGPGSDWYVLAQAVGNQLAVAESNGAIAAKEAMPDTAVDNLPRIAALYRLQQQAAAGAYGSVYLSCSQSCTIQTGSQLVDGAGLTYSVLLGGTYNDGDLVPVKGISAGDATNLDEGDILRWVSTPPFADEKAIVGPGGLINGIDAEDLEVLRGRLFDRLQTPPGTGNSTHVTQMAEASSPSVQKAFVYPALYGGASYHVAVAAAPTKSNKSRMVNMALLLSTVAPYIKGQMPEHVEGTYTTVWDTPTEVAFGLVLPEAPTANPPGPGGGWVDATPWPAPDATTSWRCTVTSVTSTTQFTVDAQTPPAAGVSQICWLSPYTWKLYSAVVTAVSGSAGAYTVTLDTPFVGILAGCYIWPRCEQAQAYCDATLAAFARMGPGEKTSNSRALARAFRRPPPASSWPYSLGGHLTRALTSAQPEVQAAQFFYRTDGTTTRTDSAGALNPQVATDLQPPNIFIPRHIAFYRVPQ